MYGYGYRYNSGLVVGAGGGAPFANTYSLSLDGVDDKVSFTSTDLGLNSTISLWVKRNTTSGTQMFLGEISYSVNYILAVLSNKLYFRIGFAVKAFQGIAVTSVMNDTTNWINIVFVRSGDSVELFLNGVSIETKTGYGTSVTTKIDTIGDTPTGGYPSNAKFDEVGLFDSAIPIADVWDGSGKPTDLNLLSTPPVAWYRFEEGSGSTAIDSGSGGNNGTLVNSPTYSTNVP